MLCITLTSYNAPCGVTSGGVSDIWVFDPSDFNWSQTTTAGVLQPYSAVALRPGATAAGGGKMFPMKFQRKEAEFKFKHSINGCSVKYEFDLSAQLPNLSNDLTNFLRSLDSAGCCCGLGLVILLNSGKIFVLGERYVNGNALPYFEVKMDGTEGGSGKKFEDFNGANVMFKGEYSRMAYEFSGGAGAIIGLQ
jgi:hypothetical protein